MNDVLCPAADSVIGIEDDEAEAVLNALSTDSARRILTALNDGARTVSELASETDLTAQNVSYHLDKLSEAGLVQTDGTRGNGGTEATVYVPARSVVVSTDTSGGQYRTGVAGIVAGAMLSFVCLQSILGPAVAPMTVLQQGVTVLLSLL